MDDEKTVETEYRRVYLLRGVLNDTCRGVPVGKDILSVPYLTDHVGVNRISELPVAETEADGYYIYRRCGNIRIDGHRIDVFEFVEQRVTQHSRRSRYTIVDGDGTRRGLDDTTELPIV